MDPGQHYLSLIRDPLKMLQLAWPHVRLYDKQVDIIQSVVDNDETIVPAGNKLGKDFISAFIVIWFFCSRSPCKVITSSSGVSQLVSVLWGEMKQFVQTSRIPLPIEITTLHAKQLLPDGGTEPRSYIKGIVTKVPENLLGHHLPQTGGLARTLFVGDEASSIDDEYYEAADTWAHKKLIIGNPLPCTNFFFRFTEQGDVRRPEMPGYYRKILRITAQDSPNVRLAEMEIAAGRKPSLKEMVPGVKGYAEYTKNRTLWDPVWQCIGLDAQFYKGAEVLLYPPLWINAAEERAYQILLNKTPRKAVTIGVDCAQGNDYTVWTTIDWLGIINQLSIKTEDTSDIPGRTIALIEQYGVKHENVIFDMGGGGKQIADQLRKKRYNVRTVAFGEKATPTDLAAVSASTVAQQISDKEVKNIYRNRRAEMYGLLRNLIDPELCEGTPFGIPAELVELRRQLAPIPLLYDGEGKMYLPPKDKPSPGYNGPTLKKMLGRSPDEADSLVMAVYGMLNPSRKVKVGIL